MTDILLTYHFANFGIFRRLRERVFEVILIVVLAQRTADEHLHHLIIDNGLEKIEIIEQASFSNYISFLLCESTITTFLNFSIDEKRFQITCFKMDVFYNMFQVY